VDAALEELAEAKKRGAAAQGSQAAAERKIERAKRALNRWALRDFVGESDRLLATLEASVRRASEWGSGLRDLSVEELRSRLSAASIDFEAAKQMVAAAIADEKRLAKRHAEELKAGTDIGERPGADSNASREHLELAEMLHQDLEVWKG